MSKIFMFLAIITMAWACNKKESAQLKDKVPPDGMAVFSYGQTQCADPWPTVQDDQKTVQNAKTYLEARGITVAAIEIRRTYDGAVCAACSCPSGKTIYVTAPADEATRAKLLALEFK